MPRFKLTIEYAGTRYSGWQIQKNARTVQGEIDRAVETITDRDDFELYGSGRTDAGVHALAQVAHLDVSTTLPPDTLRARLNDELPADINILSATVVPHRFHARHDAVARRYLYQIAQAPHRLRQAVRLVGEGTARRRPHARRARGRFEGFRDFESFAAKDASAHEPTTAPRRSCSSNGSRSSRRATSLLVGIEGSHFLWKMVRRIVGVLVEIGRGELEVAAIDALLTTSSDVPARLTAPASGLFLERVFYQETKPRAPRCARRRRWITSQRRPIAARRVDRSKAVSRIDRAPSTRRTTSA